MLAAFAKSTTRHVTLPPALLVRHFLAGPIGPRIRLTPNCHYCQKFMIPRNRRAPAVAADARDCTTLFISSAEVCITFHFAVRGLARLSCSTLPCGSTRMNSFKEPQPTPGGYVVSVTRYQSSAVPSGRTRHLGRKTQKNMEQYFKIYSAKIGI